jgi:hypothetical protein
MRWKRNRIEDGLGAMGAVDVSTILSYASKVPLYATTIAEIIDDPYLPETACQVDRLYQARKGYKVRTCTPTVPGQGGSGVGLNRAIPALKFFVYAQQNKWVLPTTVAAIVGIPFLLGLSIGRKKRSSTP